MSCASGVHRASGLDAIKAQTIRCQRTVLVPGGEPAMFRRSIATTGRRRSAVHGCPSDK
jgi:hypothetical protein